MTWGPPKAERNNRQSKFSRKLRTRFGYGNDNERKVRPSRHNETKDAIEESLKRWDETYTEVPSEDPEFDFDHEEAYERFLYS